MSNLSSFQAIVFGHVQGVYFRAFVARQARELSLTGYARNLRFREAVEVHAEGERGQLEKLIDYLKVGPPAARVDRVEIDWSEYSGNYPDFSIRY
jgi:acylphosphatase